MTDISEQTPRLNDESSLSEPIPLVDVISKLNEATSGEHNILVYSKMESLQKVYSEVCKRRLAENDIVVLLSYYETAEKVKQTLSDYGIDVDRHMHEESLIIGDSVDEIYGKNKDMLHYLLSLERRIKKVGRGCVSIIVSMDAFFLYEQIAEMLEYEGLLDLSHVRYWKVLCCYHKGNYNTLSESQRQELLSRHNRKIFSV